jgi:myo-inositol 2-dehydrogenase / D-chiro-inositol 1-dehydrogenase
VGASTVAFAGSGVIAPVHVLAAEPLGITPIAWASRSTETAAAKAAEFGGQVVSYDRLPAGADIVVVASPPGRHLTDTRRALEGGASVVLEKPLCTTLNDADRLVALAAAHSERIGYAENMAFAPVVQAMLARVATLGPANHIESRAIGPKPSYGSFMLDEWGGGALFDLGAHPLAIAVLLAGGSPVASVSAQLTGGEGHNSDEHAEVGLVFASGATAHVVASWQGTGAPVWDAQMSNEFSVVRAEIMPTAILEVDGESVEPPRSSTPTSVIEQFGYAGQWRAFTADFAAGNTPTMSAAFGRAILEITCAAYLSAGRGGMSVSLPYTGPRDRSPLQIWRALRPAAKQ